MSIFNFLSDIFTPVAKLIDDVHDSKEELGEIEVKKAQIKSKLAEVEAQVSSKIMDLQMKSIEATTKLENAVQANGNWYTKSVRPTLALMSFAIIILMGLGVMEYSDLIIKVCAGYNGIYAGLRSYEKKGK